MKTNLNIIIADEYSVVRHGLSLILHGEFKNANILHSDNYEDLALKLKDDELDIIFLDIDFPVSRGNFINTIEKIKSKNPNLMILIFSNYDETQYALRYIHAGANGFLSKKSSDSEIIKAVRSLMETRKYISDAVKEKILERALLKTPINPIESLSEREVEVAKLLVSGSGNLEISNKLNIQMTTVSTVKNRIFEKLNVSNVVKLVEVFKTNDLLYF